VKVSRTDHPYLLLSLVILIWGINHIVARCMSSPVLFGYVHITGVLLAFLRYVVGALTLTAVLFLKEGSLLKIRDQMQPFVGVLAVSILASSVFVLAANQSQAYASAGTTSIIINICPVLVLIYGILFLEEAITIPKAIGFSLGLLGGLMFLYTSVKSDGNPHMVWGVLLATIAMFAWTGYTITLHYLEGVNRLAVISIQLIVSSLLIVPFLGVYLMTSPLDFVLDIWSILGILFCGVVSSGIGYLLFFRTIEAIGAPKAASFLFLIPFVSLLGDIMLQELPQPVTLLGGIVAILGVALIKIER
jgi:drug/metabolite transporter (DMT)-like permease